MKRFMLSYLFIQLTILFYLLNDLYYINYTDIHVIDTSISISQHSCLNNILVGLRQLIIWLITHCA